MTKLYKYGKFLSVIAFASLLFVFGVFSLNIAEASHSWGNYHWSRPTNPLTLTVGDNVSSVWDSYLNTALSDWSTSSVTHLNKVVGLTNPRRCKPALGRIEVCNSKYGNNGWLGLAQIWVNGSHITQAVAKMNDTYFNTSKYNTPAWRQLVMCQEVAHDFGLDHQDESFSNLNLGTCMDYTSKPSGPPSNEHPNTHDYEQLELIYAHLDATVATLTTRINGQNQRDTERNGEIDFSDRAEWGRELRRDSRGRANLYERDLSRGKKVITHVLWIDSIEE